MSKDRRSKDDDDDGWDEEDDDENAADDMKDQEDEDGDDKDVSIDNRPRIEEERAEEFSDTLRKLNTFYDELSKISAKRPNDPINTFKVKLINETIEKANFVLGDSFRPFPGFSVFSEEDMPSASDVVMMLSHYRKSMAALRSVYYRHDHWYVVGGERFYDPDADD